jgi:hypothetical protein
MKGKFITIVVSGQAMPAEGGKAQLIWRNPLDAPYIPAKVPAY